MSDVERVRLQILPRIPLLKTESVEKCVELRRTIQSTLQPSDAIEQIYVDDIVQHQLEISRLRRSKVALINMELPSVLTNVIMRLRVNAGEIPQFVQRLNYPGLPPPDQKTLDDNERHREAYNAARDLSRRCFTEPKAREQVDSLLRRFGVDESVVEAKVVRKMADELDLLDRMLTSLESRRNKALACFHVYRTSFVTSTR